ncbi:ADP-ribose pyrophosphatase YjhB (NUDIX family) [Bacillus mesophilus]|uniref:NUDIX domain-containing protein n=1 Tax=Bacillus mesophilus TaxID=1808955 RepID=A0A6M0QAS7_9BACI|nr:NUDIX domain-containing protein [Bacillus mesophilus]MBM7662802.1 ADP-ribose pyrophosphatase YjhB (NUDIX family) [Bacillus mesophilus]NEY73393.1 NUDIX domain-containing protein [Bacillus mesophilus]
MKWEDSYIGNLRSSVGSQKLIVPSIRAIIEDNEGKILFIERLGEGKWSMPAGSIELNETIYDCLVREVKEETGLEVLSAKAIAIYSNPKFSTKNKFGDEYQLFELLFCIEEWTGSLKQNTEETSSAQFFKQDEIPQGTNEFWTSFHKQVINDLITFKENKQFIIK